ENYIEQTVAANLAIYAVVIDEQKSLEQRKEEVAHILASMGLPSAQVEAQLGTLFSPWYRTFLVLDPSRYLGGLSIPVMILNGTKDTQVSADLQVSAIEKALREGGNLRFTTKIYDGLNHLFQPAITGAVEEYGVIEVTMDPQVLADIAWWVTEGRLQL
ncbi:MAG: alpha/beta hydrolase, partial [Sphaerochaetaceae bacterium]|nr:alpha/beta hydrolase [Sphaerochaetaceae bacterium]